MRKKSDRKPNEQAGIRDVAASAGVSIATVSRVLNGTAYVLPETRARVEAAMETLRFVPRSAARALAGNRTMTIGLLVPEISGDFFVPMLRGIESVAAAAGYALLIQTTAVRRAAELSRMLDERNADGLLLFENSIGEEELGNLRRSGFPVVLLYSEALPPSAIPSVTVENEKGAAAAVEHLGRVHDRRRIVCLTGPAGNHDAAARERGYRSALDALGIGYRPELVVPGDFSSRRASDSIRGLLAAGIRFDAVFAGDDGAALGVLSALRGAGRVVPADVAVVGFDDQARAAEFSPSLSTVRAPTEDVGIEAARILLRRINGEGTVTSRILPTVFVPRASCGCESGDLSGLTPEGEGA